MFGYLGSCYASTSLHPRSKAPSRFRTVTTRRADSWRVFATLALGLWLSATVVNCRWQYERLNASSTAQGGDLNGGANASGGTQNVVDNGGTAGISEFPLAGAGGSANTNGSTPLGTGGTTSLGTGGLSSGGFTATSGGTATATGGLSSGGATIASGGAIAASGGTTGVGGTLVAGCVWNSYASSTYASCSTTVSYDVAVTRCSSMGMRLVRIDSAAENAWVAGLANDPWIGASDIAVEGEWRWADGTLFWLGDNRGTPVNNLYNAWAKNDPSGSPTTANCARLGSSAANWVDAACSSNQPYVCEVY